MARGGAGQFNITRLFADHNGETLSKKDDDLGKTSASSSSLSMNARIQAPLWSGKALRPRNRRRWLLTGLFAFAVWYMIWGVPAEWWEPNRIGLERQAASRLGGGRRGGASGNERAYPPSFPRSSSIDADWQFPPPRPKGKIPSTTDLQYYDGEIIFPRLSATLRDYQLLLGFRRVNQNILFAASNPKSLGTILPLACDMAKRGKSSVHIVIFGRTDLAYEEMIKLNGMDKDECRAYWHDARPNWAAYSSEYRAEASVASALSHLQEFIRPQSVIMDDSIIENGWFVRQIRSKAQEYDWPIIELPAGASEQLHWISRLDSSGLKVFHKTTIDILVQAPNGAAGGLMRLLNSLSAADYSGTTPPRLTIELPADIDHMVSWYVKGFKWPPESSALQPRVGSTFTVRHRIPGQRLSPEEAAVRFMESYFPAHENSHVLILSPNVELSPSFYYWLKYYVLHYKASRAGLASSDELIGLSLSIPNTYLNGTTDFVAPQTINVDSLARSDPVNDDTKPPFAWQAPASDAVLYFGDHWAEIHDYLKHRIRKAKDGKGFKKTIGEHMPAWTEYVLELMRARGWHLMFPPSGRHVAAMVTVHEESSKPPEEFFEAFEAARLTKELDEDGKDIKKRETSRGKSDFLRGQSSYWETRKTSERPLSTTHQPLHTILPFQGEEPSVVAVPHLKFDGQILALEQVLPLYEEYAELFRQTVGDCEFRKGQTRKVVAGQAGDLFCWGNEKASDWVKSSTLDSRNEAIV